MRVRCAAEGVSSDRNEATLNVDIGKRRRHQNGLIDRTAHRRNEACLVHSRSKDGSPAAPGFRRCHRSGQGFG